MFASMREVARYTSLDQNISHCKYYEMFWSKLASRVLRASRDLRHRPFTYAMMTMTRTMMMM